MIIKDNVLRRVKEEDIINGIVTIPEGVTFIGGDAFLGCNSMVNVIIPESVKVISARAFNGCSLLTSIELPKGLTALGEGVFDGCSLLTSISIPESITYIPPYTFARCSSLTSVNLPDSIDDIAHNAFRECTSLTNIHIPESVTKIRDSVFCGCTKLTNVNIPQGVEMIEDETFRECSNLVSIQIPESVKSIGRYAFDRCSNLTNVDMPSSLNSIGDHAFAECSKLSSIDIPEGITVISSAMFSDCQELTRINLPKSIANIETGAFAGCENLTNIDIPESVNNIGNWAFQHCSKLTSIQIPEGVTNIGEFAFEGCNGLTTANIPKGITKIRHSMFAGCSGLTSIHIPESITEIEPMSFGGCSGLTSIHIPEGVTGIGAHAFMGCSNLNKVNIPEKITNIEDGLFENCKGLTNIQISDGVVGIGYRAFCGCSNLTNINIPNTVKAIEQEAFRECKLIDVTIPEGVANIGAYAFYDCKELTNIHIPDSVTRIQDYAFAKCSNLTSISIPSGVTRIGQGAFSSCFALTSVNIPNSLIEMGSDLFDECYALSDVNVADDFYKKENLLFKLFNTLEVTYWEDYDNTKIPKIKKLMFGDNLEKFNEIESQAHFNLSQDYDFSFMNELYHKIIYSVGLDELEKMVKIPGLDAEQLAKYNEAFRRKEEIFKNLYEEKQVLDGDFGTVTSILKQLALSINNDENGKKSDELDILKQVNLLLDTPDNRITSLKDLMDTAMKNAGYDSSKIVYNIEELQRSLNKSQFQSNMDNVRADIVEALSSNDTTFGEQLAPLQIEAIEKIVEDKLRKIYMANSKVSMENLREELIEELQDSSHAIYICRNANNIASRLINLLDSNKEFKNKINHNSVEALKNVRNQIGGRWIDSIKKAFKAACDGQNIESIPDEFSIDQIDILKEKLNIDIKTNQRAVLKKGADRDKAYQLLEDIQTSMPEEERLIVTYKQLHDMFGGVHYPYSEEFKKFFKVNREEFLRNPKYIYEFATICNNFESIINSPELKNVYQNGKLELDDILGYLGGLNFENQRPGDEKLAQLSSSVGKIVTDEQFAEVQNVFDIVKNRERTSIPPVFVQEHESKFRGRMLSPNDILNMFAGNITDCCQRFGDVGMGAMLLGSIEENAGIFVIEELQENGNYQMIGQSLTIRQKGIEGNYDRLTFDNIEIAKNVKARLSKSDENEILKIYQDAGKQAMDLDAKFLKELLKQGKITQEDFDNIVLKEAIAGRGYNDLNALNTLQEAQTVVPDEAYYSYRSKEWGETRPWIDSTQSGAPTGSNSYKPVLIAEMDKSKLEKINARRMESNKKISDLTNIPLWYGKVDEPIELAKEKIGEQQIEIMKNIERKVYRPSQQLMNNERVRDYRDMRYAYELNDVSAVIGSQKNWYMIYGTGEKGECIIQDLALEGGLNSGKNKESTEKQNSSRLATVEMANEVYSLMIKKAKEETKIICNATKDTSLINIKNMVKKGIAELCDSKGKKVIISKDGELVYEDGSEVIYRNYEYRAKEDEPIKMIDLEIKPNIERMIEEKIKLEKYLGLAKKITRMKATEKEKGLDDKRRNIRNDR